MVKNLCDVCRPILRMQSRDTVFDDLLHLGSPSKIAQREDCALCRITLGLLEQSGVSKSECNSTVTLNPRFCDGYVGVSIDGSPPEETLGWIEVLDTTTQSGMAREHSLSIESLRSSELDPQTVLHWMKECDEHHQTACQNTLSSSVHRKIEDLFLIDVYRESLDFVVPGATFVALSYVWGDLQGRDILRHTRGTFDTLKSEGSLRSLQTGIPTVIRDAMRLCRSIGQRYLWCDLLCIREDDKSIKHRQIRPMDAIYNQAPLTIVALSGAHSFQPLPGLKPRTRPPICLVEELGHEALLMSRAPRLGYVERHTLYESRRWTFQERLISRRCLFLTDRQMYFQCPSASLREDDALAQLRGPRRCYPSILYSEPTSLAKLISETDVFKAYATLLSQYTGRRLAYSSDRLKAFEGIAQILGRRFRAEL